MQNSVSLVSVVWRIGQVSHEKGGVDINHQRPTKTDYYMKGNHMATSPPCGKHQGTIPKKPPILKEA
jgi:hypothetical protein